jgi:type 2 lantibiotic biosynthesis protein LanM
MTRRVDPAWYRALSLSERVAAGPSASAPAEPSERAAWRLRRWRGQSPFERDDLFQRRLDLDGLDPQRFLALLDEPPEELARRAGAPAPWMERLEALLAGGEAEPAAPSPLFDGTADPGADPSVTRQLLAVFRPLIDDAWRRLEEGARRLAKGFAAPFDPAAIPPLFWSGAEVRLMTMAGRTLVLELHVARVEGRLEGETSEERFRDFVRRLRQRDVQRALLQEYPVLARQVLRVLDRWVLVTLEFLSRLCDDLALLEAELGGGEALGRLADVHASAGDLHRGGRSVVLARFTSGTTIVYKPRAMTVDERFQELLAWVDERSGLPPFRRLRILDRGAYGWSEFVATAPCASRSEVERFHLRLGGLLALFYLLEATDLHYENLLAAGEHPVAVDLETLFHPSPQHAPSAQADQRLLEEHLAHSVLRVGLLPFQIGAADDFGGLDISGLAIVEGELTPSRVLTWESPGTDQMRAVRQRLPLPAGENRPRLDGREVEAVEQLEPLLGGFARVYRLLAENREELLAPEGLLARFGQDPVRAVLRATRGYHLIWFESFHPDLLADALDRDFFLDRLWVGIEDHPPLQRALPWERRDLDLGDIPAFAARPGSVDLESASGEPLPDFFPAPPLAAVRRKLAGLSELDLYRQQALIRASLSTQIFRRETIAWPSYRARRSNGGEPLAALRPRLLAHARAVGERLARDALRSPGHTTWIGVEFSQKRWSLLALPEDLYIGLPGVALFFAFLGAITAEERWTALARDAVATLLDRLERQNDPPRPGEKREKLTSIGAFQGWGGVVYALANLARLWRDDELAARALTLLEAIPPLLPADQDRDLIGGAAGAAGALLAVHRTLGSLRALEIAAACGESLLARAEPAGEGLGWRSRIEAEMPQIGFSHGAAGYAWALWRLAAATGDSRFHDAALGGFRYEHGCYDPKRRNWLDAGDPETTGRPRQGGERSTCLAWCYGAPGVALSRLVTLGENGAGARAEPFLQQDLERALRTTRRSGFGCNHSLCHGDLGNLDILLQAERKLGDRELARDVARRATQVLASLDRHGPLCGTPAGIESPGLMNGFAGIGYGLLRLADPERVPSVLGLEGVG